MKTWLSAYSYALKFNFIVLTRVYFVRERKLQLNRNRFFYFYFSTAYSHLLIENDNLGESHFDEPFI